MMTTKTSLAIAMLLSLLTVWGCQSAGNQSADKTKDMSQAAGNLPVDKKKDVSGQFDPTSE